jgi:hypothetical protein
MKKISYLIISIIMLHLIYACAGYKPIYTTDLKFEIADYNLRTNKILGRQIYSKLYNLSKSNKNQEGIKSIYLTINVLKEKKPTSKDTAGKILEYKVNLNTKVVIKNYLTNKKLLDKNFIFSSSYKVQDQYSETIKLENKLVENLINQTYQELIIKLSENIL